MTMKKILPVILAAALILCILPAAALAANPVYTAGTPTELSDALGKTDSAYTIQLTANFTYNSRIQIYGKTVTFDLNAHTLSVVGGANNGLQVGNDEGTIGGTVYIAGSGTLSVSSTGKDGVNVGNDGILDITESAVLNTSSSANAYDGVYAHDGGKAEVTNASTTGSGGVGARVSDSSDKGSYIRVTGNATGIDFGVYANAGHIVVDGDVRATGESGTGVYASATGGEASVGGNAEGGAFGVQAMGHGVAKVDGNVLSNGTFSRAVAVMTGGMATIGGSVTAGGIGSTGVYAKDAGSMVTVNGGVTTNSTFTYGIHAEDGGNAVVKGSISVPEDGAYIRLQGSNKAITDGVPGMGDYASYLKYSDGNNNIVYVNTGAVCWIGSTPYKTLDEALIKVVNGEIIELAEDISDTDGIIVTGKSFTFDLNGYTLSATSDTDFVDGFKVGGGATVNIAGNGEFDASNSGVNASGLKVDGGAVNLTGSGTLNASSSGGNGLEVVNAGTVGITGTGTLNASSSKYGFAGVYAGIDCDVKVTSAASTGGNGAGANADGTGSYIEVTGNATATGSSCFGAIAYGGGAVKVDGTVTSDVTGVWVYSGGTATIDGTVSAPVYINLEGSGVTASQWTGEDEDYLIYADATNTVKVMTINAGISPASATFSKDPANTNYKDITTTFILNSATQLNDVRKDGVTIGTENFSVDTGTNTLTIKRDYLKYKPVSSNFTLSVVFNAGNAAALTINITDGRQPICEIGTAQYTSLDEALLSVGSGETKTIKLLRDIAYNSGITVSGRNITFNLNGRNLNVVNAEGNGLDVGSGGVVNIMGSGAFNAESGAEGSSGVYAHNGGQAKVTKATSTASFGAGAYAAGTGSIIEVTGNAEANGYGAYATGEAEVSIGGDANGGNAVSAAGVFAEAGGQIDVDGNAVSTGNSSYGARANGGVITVGGYAQGVYLGAFAEYSSSITITGDCITTGPGGIGASAYISSTIDITGSVDSRGAGSLGIATEYSGSATVVVRGDVTASNTGVLAYNGGKADVYGKINVPSGETNYIMLQDTGIPASGGEVGENENVGYFVFTDTSNTVRVKIKSAAISPNTAEFDKYAADEDITVNITWNDAESVSDVELNGTTIGMDNFVADTVANTLTIKKEYLAGQPLGELDLAVKFNIGSPAALAITIKAQVITVTFNAAGGKVSPSTMPATYKQPYGVLPKPTRTGYYFYGWYTGNKTLIEADSIVETTSNITLYARWVSNSLVALSTPSLTVKAPDYKTVTLTWKSVKGAEGYIIYKKDGSSYKKYAEVDRTSLSYTDTNVTKGTYYYYQVQAFHTPYQTMVYSSRSYYKYARPAWPAISLKTAYTYNSIKLTWNTVTGATAYEVQRYNKVSGKYEPITNESTVFDYSADNKYVSYTDEGLAKGTTYYYKVRAYDTSDTGILSSYRYAKTAWPAISLKTAYTYNSIKLTWNTVTGATAYEVQRYNKVSGKYEPITNESTVFDYSADNKFVSYTDEELAKGTTYYYKVRAYAPSDTGILSSYRYAKTAWPSVSFTVSSASYNSILVKWNPVAGADKYEVQRCEKYNGTYVPIPGAEELTTTSYTDLGRTTGKTYYYKVRAYVSDTEYKLSGYKYAKPAWPAVSFTVSSASYNSILVKWNPVAGAKYEVQRCEKYNGTYVPIPDAKELTTTSYTDLGRTTGKTYYYKVRAYVSDTEYKLSGYKYAKPAWPAVSFTVSSASYNSIKLTWKLVAGATAYEVQRYNKVTGKYERIAGEPTELDNTVEGFVSYTDKALSTGNTYYYKIKAYDAASSDSGVLSSYKYTKPVPAAPVIALDRKNINMTVSWGEVEGKSGYMVYRATSLKGTYSYIATVTSGTSYVNTGLYTSKYYYYKVRAYRKVGSTTVYGPYSAVKYM